MDFTVNNGLVQWGDRAALRCYCIGGIQGDFVMSKNNGRPLYNLKDFPHTVNGEICNDIHEFQDEFLNNGATPPTENLIQWLPEPVGTDRIDKVGVRDGETFKGIYATGISELQLDDLTGLTIAEFNGTSTYSIVGNSVILDPLLTFSSLVDSDGNIYSLESLYNSNVIIGTQNCIIIGTPLLLESIEYKSWRNLLGYNLVDSIGIGMMRIGSTFIIG